MEWPFQSTAFLGSANPKATKVLKWSTGADVPRNEDDVGIEDAEYAPLSNQLYMVLALMCRGQALVMIRSVTGNDGLETWRVLNAYYDTSSKGRQRARMRQLLQPQKPDDVASTREAIERWEKDIRDYETRFNKTFDEDVKIVVTVDLAPFSVQHCHLSASELKTYAQVRCVILDYIEAAA